VSARLALARFLATSLEQQVKPRGMLARAAANDAAARSKVLVLARNMAQSTDTGATGH